MNKEYLFQHTIYHVITGSTVYGLRITTSDQDEKALVLLPLKEIIQLGKEWETSVFHEPDLEFHSLKKFMNLMLSQNPTVLELLFVPESFILKQTDYGEMLRNQRYSFLSKKCYFTFGGYAKDQLMRIKKNQKVKSEQKLYKHAMHLTRLLLMGIEILQEGELIVNRQKDYKLLMDIRNGEVSWIEFFKFIDDLFLKLEKANNQSILPENPDLKKANDLYFSIVKEYFHLK
ncbi:nucleotidyltransferase domain-containing protein [Bacillaceae bacterium S4-13-58]